MSRPYSTGWPRWHWYAIAAAFAITTGPRLILWAIDRHADAIWIAANMGDNE
jgi:hypothetical protein